jgi:transmembrane protein EpsG
MRHSIAVSILILGYKFYEQRKIIKYLIITILAAQFHNTALIMILAYFIPDWRRNKVILFSYFISLFVIINGQYILQSILKILSTLYFLPPRTIYLLSLYTKAENAAAGKDVLKSGFGLLVLVMLVTMVVIFHLRIKKNKYVPAFITVFFFIACGFNIMILSRFAYYFSVSFAGLVAYNLLLEKRFYKYLSYLRLIVVLLFIIYFSLLMIRFIFSNENIKFYLPYKSIISIS